MTVMAEACMRMNNVYCIMNNEGFGLTAETFLETI